MSKATEAHISIVVSGFEAGKSDDEIIREIFETGVDFKDLRVIFNEVVASQGLRLSAKERKTLTTQTLEGWTPETHSEVIAKAEELGNLLKLSESKTLTAIRAWAKEEKVELPKAERKAREMKVGFGGHVRTLLDHLLANREETREGLEAFCKLQGISPKYVPVALNVVAFANEYNPDAPVEVEAPAPKKSKKAA